MELANVGSWPLAMEASSQGPGDCSVRVLLGGILTIMLSRESRLDKVGLVAPVDLTLSHIRLRTEKGLRLFARKARAGVEWLVGHSYK